MSEFTPLDAITIVIALGGFGLGIYNAAVNRARLKVEIDCVALEKPELPLGWYVSVTIRNVGQRPTTIDRARFDVVPKAEASFTPIVHRPPNMVAELPKRLAEDESTTLLVQAQPLHAIARQSSPIRIRGVVLHLQSGKEIREGLPHRVADLIHSPGDLATPAHPSREW